MKLTGWRKSSYSGNQTNCVEVGRLGDRPAIRDSKDRTGRILTVTPEKWTAFLNMLKNNG
ncbi:DUF397 domain-containing protein [Saccharopolyspora sp. SCSIO 74807]|uniref:DUF397 domain-containing protein n=1 Tax=Saccharopolyspora sp. SCSIO 74807 TaxID=3118084 RepID=UPI0030CD6F80